MPVHVTVIQNSRHVTNYNLSSGTRTAIHFKATSARGCTPYMQHVFAVSLDQGHAQMPDESIEASQV
jgi:hypothetical protein